jgi:nucleoside-diphosphate-sugar epimerase
VRLIVTGSSGQIGTNFALRCVAQGHTVLGVDLRANEWTDAFPTVLADLREPIAIAGTSRAGPDTAWGQPDTIVHFAGHAKVHALVRTPRRAFENIAMTQNALELCRALDVPFVFASSREVYGDVHREPAREEEAPLDPAASAYAASKIAGETMVHAYARSYGLRHLIFRLSNVYGRYDDDLERMERVVPLFIHRIGDGQPVTVFGADKVIDFTYVDDCIDGILAGVERLVAGSVRNETINLSGGGGHSLLAMVEHVGRALGQEPRVIVAPKRSGEVTHYVADLGRARALLDFAPKIGLEEGIARAVAWHFEWQRRQRPVALRESKLSSWRIKV